jgi:uncharacterized membrane protein
VLFRFLVYGALGWCAEILWTALTRRLTNRAPDWLLMGETSLWSFFLYGSIVFLYEPLHDLLRAQPLGLRAAAYLIGFWMVEFLGGWLIWKLSGSKPWDYSRSAGGSLRGLIRWNFVLVWPLVGLALEPLHDILVQLTPLVTQLFGV